MTTATDTIDAKITLEDAGPCRKRLQIEISPAAVAAKLAEAEGGFSTETALPGFRKGKAPASLIRKRFGSAIESEAKQQLISAAYSQAVEEHKLRVLGEPEGGDELADLSLSKDSAISFSIEVEVAPDFDMPTFDGTKVLRPTFEVTDELIQEQLDKMATNEGSLQPLEEAGPGDYCMGHGKLVLDKDGEGVLDVPGAVVQLPTEGEAGGMILGVLVDDLAKQAGAPKPGETLTIKTTGPKNHESETIRDEPITITYDVETVQRIIPADIEKLVATYGMGGEEQLREAITLRLNQRVHIEQQSAMRQQMAKTLLEAAEFELPEKTTTRQAERNLHRRRLDLMYRGVPEQEVEQRVAELRNASDEVARRELKLFFMLDRIANENEIGVNEAEINGRIAAMAAERGERPEKLRAQLIRSDGIQGIAQQIREHKAMDLLISKAEIKDVTADEFREQFADDEDAVDGAAGEKKSAASKKTSKKTTTKKTTKKTSKKKSSTKKDADAS